MNKSNPTKDPEFKRVLGNLLNTPPKHHKDMKVGNTRRDKRPKTRAEEATEREMKERREGGSAVRGARGRRGET